MTHQDCVEYLRSQNLRNEVRRYVQIKVSHWQHNKKVAEQWFEDNMNPRSYWVKKEKYNEILGEKERDRDTLRKGVMKIVLEMFERKYGKPLQ